MSEDIEVLKTFDFIEYLRNGANVEKYEKQILALENVAKAYCQYRNDRTYFTLPQGARAFIIHNGIWPLYSECNIEGIEIFSVKTPTHDGEAVQILIAYDGHVGVYVIDPREELYFQIF